jgi:hypothetical protein
MTLVRDTFPNGETGHNTRGEPAGAISAGLLLYLLNYFQKPVLWCHANQCAISSVGRAVRLHRKGQEFESLIAHRENKSIYGLIFI